jgi:hypothetical protein
MIVWKRFYTFDFWEFTCTADVNVIWYWWISWTWYHWVTQCRWSTWGQCPDNQVALILDCTMHGGPRADMHRGLIIMVCSPCYFSMDTPHKWLNNDMSGKPNNFCMANCTKWFSWAFQTCIYIILFFNINICLNLTWCTACGLGGLVQLLGSHNYSTFLKQLVWLIKHA